MVDLRPLIRAGDGIWWGQAAAGATPLVDALLDQVGDIGPVRAFCGLTFNRRLGRDLPREITLTSYGAMGELCRAPRLQVVAGLIEDGDTIQIGVGALSTAVLDGLSGHRDLGFHSGMMTDGVLRLVDKGVITGRRKEVDQGLLVTGTAIGSADLYARLGEMPVEFRPASYTHSARVLARSGRLVSINSALQVDLSGQVGAEVARGARGRRPSDPYYEDPALVASFLDAAHRAAEA